MMPRRPCILVFIDLVQDLDVLLPVLLSLRQHGGWRISVWVSRWLDRASPRVSQALVAEGFAIRSVRRRAVISGKGPSLKGVDVLLTASESTAPAHAGGYALVKSARAAGIFTATFQHGLENVGLTPDSTGHWDGLASDSIFCWFDRAQAHPELPESTRRRLVTIGRPVLSERLGPPEFDLGVFENLHWDRYSDQDRARFRDCLFGLIEARPECSLYVRAHPAGGWLDEAAEALSGRPNLTFVSSALAREQTEGGRQAATKMRRIITTPSTIALDSVMAGRPVALAGHPAPAYAPLPVLNGPEDWLDFADGRADGQADHEFLNRWIAPVDWAGSVNAHLSRVLKR